MEPRLPRVLGLFCLGFLIPCGGGALVCVPVHGSAFAHTWRTESGAGDPALTISCLIFGQGLSLNP